MLDIFILNQFLNIFHPQGVRKETAVWYVMQLLPLFRTSLTRSSERVVFENNPGVFLKIHVNYRKEFSDRNKDEKVNTGECCIKIISKNKVQMLSLIKQIATSLVTEFMGVPYSCNCSVKLYSIILQNNKLPPSPTKVFCGMMSGRV